MFVEITHIAPFSVFKKVIDFLSILRFGHCLCHQFIIAGFDNTSIPYSIMLFACPSSAKVITMNVRVYSARFKQCGDVKRDK